MIRVQSSNWHDSIEVSIRNIIANKMFVVKQLVYEKHEEGIIESTTTITRQEAQVLMDDLWQCGLRPSEGSGSAGALAATQRHLDDMRKISFNLMEIR